MRYFERKRRATIKEHYVCGTAKSVSGNDSVEIISSAGVPFERLEISGRTEQQFMDYKDYFSNLENYIYGGISYTYVIPFPEEWIGKSLKFVLTEKTKMTDISFDVTDGIGLFVNSDRLLDYNGDIKVISSNQYTHFRFTSVLTDEKTEISDFWANYTLTVIGEMIDFPQKIQCLNDDGMTIEINNNIVNISTSVNIGGKEIPLLMSEYDKLIVDGTRKKVIYTEGSWKTEFVNGNKITLHNWASNNGYGKNYIYQKYYHNTDFENYGYCNYFPKAELNLETFPDNAFGLYPPEGYVYFRVDGELSLADFQTWVKEKYDEGNPLTILIKRKTPIEHDITRTELGQALLSLCVPRGERGEIRVTGALDEIPLKVTYYSTEKSDTVTLTIRYVNENGEEIDEPKAHNVRQGSKYLIVAPHIDGYKRVSSEVYGVADENATIELIYKEE